MNPVPFFDLTRQMTALRVELTRDFERVLASGRFVLGVEVGAFESEVARYLGAAHVIAVSSGTDALLAALIAAGVGPGDEVVTTPFTFVATAMTIVRLGAVPVYADIEADTFNLSPRAVADLLGPRTRAILPVHAFGRCADLASFRHPADAHGAVLIEDAAQALGAGRAGWDAGTAGRFGCFSFFPSKNLGALGDGGMVVAADADDADLLRRIRVQGQRTKYVAEHVGGNFRLDELQAAFLRTKLTYLTQWQSRRAALAQRYRDASAERGLGDLLTSAPAGDEKPTHHQFVVRHPRRDELRRWLSDRSIGTEIYYPVPLHRQPALCPARPRRPCLEAERACLEVLALPLFPELTDGEQERVIEAVLAFVASA